MASLTPTTFELTDTEDPALAPDRLVERLRASFGSPSYRPPALPQVAVELLRLAGEPEVEVDDVVRLLERDPVLAGRALERSNAAAYASAAPIRSVRQAIVRLGLNAVRNLVLEIALDMRVFKSAEYRPTMDRIRVHSGATAAFARFAARYTSLDPEFAFLCGLLHDVGCAAGLIVLSERGRQDAPIPLDAAWRALEPIHEEASAAVVRGWKLGPEVELIVGAHHSLEHQRVPHPYRAVVGLAEALAGELGAGIDERPALSDASGMAPRRAAGVLGLSDKQLALIRAEAAQWVSADP